MRALLDAFPQGRVILLLDNFENLVDAEKLAIKDGEMSDALSALLTAPQHAVKAILTTRIAPRDLAMVEPGRQHPLDLDDGLESPYAENVLREMDADGRVGLKNAPEPLLNKAREKTRGYPRALEALYAILSVDRYTTLEELLEIELPKEVVEKLVGEAFNRLDPTAQKVMQALAIYNRPVSPAAIDYLLQPHLPSIDSALVLNRLVNMHFARREAGRYYLHPADREYAFGTIPVEELLTTKDTKVTKENPNKTLRSLRALRFNTFTQHGLIERAADFFAQARKPRAEWKKLDDLAAQLAEFDLRCAAGDYDSAASVLLEIDFDYLLLWGHYRLMIDMHLHVKDKITDKTLLMGNLNGLGLANQFIGNNKESVIFYDQGLEVAHESKDRSWQGSILGNLGNTYVYLGDTRKAIECYEQALIISREIGDQLLEGNQLGSMGTAYHYLGNIQKAIEYQKAALEIAQNIGDRKGESNRLGNLGNRYSELGDDEKAIEYYEKCIFVKQEIGDRSGESIVLGNSGNVWTDIGEYQKAKESYQRAIQIADEISFSKVQQGARSSLAEAYLFQNDLANARATIEVALQYDVPMDNHNASALQGIIALRQGEKETAQAAFKKSIAQADKILAKTPEYYSALDAKGLALCGMALTTGDSHLKDDCHLQAIETFRAARKIAPHAGVVKSVLRLFDELAKCDPEGILKGVRDAAEGK